MSEYYIGMFINGGLHLEKREYKSSGVYQIWEGGKIVGTLYTNTDMIDPQNVVVVEPKATYEIPAYMVTNEGIQDAGTWRIEFCKGNRADESIPRQVGVFTESLIAAAKKYLEENNVGDLATRDTSTAITKLDEALLWIGKRAADRQRRGVQGTYQK